MLLLVVDTSSPVVAAAVHDGDSVVGAASRTGAQAHGELLAPVVEEALREAGAHPSDLTDVCAGVGPGPFTGLRVGVVTARVMGEALGVPVHGVCSLDVLAFQAFVDSGFSLQRLVVATDARRQEVYVRRYGRGAMPVGPPEVARPGDLDDATRDALVVGPGAEMYAQHFPHRGGPTALDPVALAELVAARLEGGGDLLPPEPLYLRRPDAVANATRKRVTPS